ncbi:SAC3/GANP/Nin1/mts3/eIF-3 p25 family-domain-containing protein [Melampsora americana]|nr:SAC3/GANP/Nin1/mts3/eIF-3 p25 family-domain-containing protein [Melampsora americana]
MASSNSWPPPLKEFVNKTFARCTDSNRADVEVELKGLIFNAYKEGKLWEVDWASVQLNTLTPGHKRKENALTFTSTSTVVNVEDEDNRRQKRLRRFDKPNQNQIRDATCAVNAITIYDDVTEDYQKNIPDWDHHTIVGHAKTVEKPYLRLTAAPNPAEVRPLEVCKQTLDHLKNKWRQEGNYNWICDQFKSLRQDLTVQRIKNEFTVSVYENHARIALEKSDLGEFNQCTSQLRQLYKQGIKGHQEEFLAYYILYLIYSRNSSVRFAVSTANYRRFFQLFCQAPKMGGYLMDCFVERERIRALATMAIPNFAQSQFVTKQLAFDTEEECRRFLQRHNALYYYEQQQQTWDARLAKDCFTTSSAEDSQS